MRSDGSDLRALTDEDRLVQKPAWSFDGKFVFFSAQAPPRLQGLGVLRVDVTTGALQVMPFGADAMSPVPSRDGRWMAFSMPVTSSTSPSLGVDVFVAQMDGSSKSRVTGSPSSVALDWSADGEWILVRTRVAPVPVVGVKNNVNGLWKVRRDGSDAALLVRDAMSGSWSPDGLSLVYLSGTITAVSGTSVVRADGEGKRPVVILK